MKYLYFVSVAFSIFSGTSLTATAQNHINAVHANDGIVNDKSIKFIEGIEIKGENVSSMQLVKPLPVLTKNVVTKINIQPATEVPEIEHFSTLQFKYAQLLDINVEEAKNSSLYQFIDEWWDTKYRYGGTGKKGIDCSALTRLLMESVFDINLPRTAREQFKVSSKLSNDVMTEGDLVFFNTRRGVSHVGVYLGNGYFVHASTSNGVTINNLNESYYNNRFLGAGRVLDTTIEN